MAVTDGWIALGFAAAVAFVGTTLWWALATADIRPLRTISDFLRKPWFESGVLLVCAFGAIQTGSTKGTNGNDRTAASVRARSAAARSADDLSSPATMEESGLRFTGFGVSSNGVWFSAAWSLASALPEGVLDLFATADLATNFWEYVGSYDVPAAETNLADTIERSLLPGVEEGRLFLRLGTHADSDGDGLFDAWERLRYGTSPFFADTDGDGLTDGEERTHVPALDPLDCDSDGDGYSDGEEVALGMDPLTADGGAGLTVRYCYNMDGRMVSGCAGAGAVTTSVILTPAGNERTVSVTGN